ncbi:hypothetical protein GCM10023215_19040 [Pseudonocardia yuanmonensis]|uniref:Uncharacterized protein n=1 Tax=Pseudonocardia yuanmonensis TaxID=1095914 RepID=A0ABP8WBN4_9PSEU
MNHRGPHSCARCRACSSGSVFAPASTEHRELGERTAVDPRRRREDDPIQLRRGEAGRADRRSSPGRHGLHPAQPRVGGDGPGQRGGVVLAGDAVERLVGVEQLLEPPLLTRGATPRGIAGVVRGPAHRRQQPVVADQGQAGFPLLDEPAELLVERGGQDDAHDPAPCRTAD